MPHHARLGQGEARKHAHRVERDQQVDVAPECDEQHAGQDRQTDDAHREGEAVAAKPKHARQETVAGKNRGQAREVGE